MSRRHAQFATARYQLKNTQKSLCTHRRLRHSIFSPATMPRSIPNTIYRCSTSAATFLKHCPARCTGSAPIRNLRRATTTTTGFPGMAWCTHFSSPTARFPIATAGPAHPNGNWNIRPGGRCLAASAIRSPAIPSRSAITAAPPIPSMVWHGGRLFALEESHQPFELDSQTLASKGHQSFDGQITSRCTAHPKADPATGELHFFAYSAEGPGTTGMLTACWISIARCAACRLSMPPMPA